MQQIITEANMEGWGSLEVLDLMEKILKKLQLTYAAEDTPHSALIEGELEPSGDLPLEE
ncbi:hypothetical protein LP421_07820 [Rhizobium sp. RCAM05350]|nr:hypothetical protein LP421_07820 [Rhizobium sp. RCAM05350]